jgi:uncharacterized protein YijF (DUF1287 family)
MQINKYIWFILLAGLTLVGRVAESGPSSDFVAAARRQIGQTLHYDPSYQHIGYPNGDVPRDRGVCTDVVIRALRRAYAYDLQRRVHEDMRQNFARYPQLWGLTRPDRNIDHRRVPNLRTFFKRQGWALPLSRDVARFQTGDIVTCIVPPHLPHIMIVSDRRGPDDTPLVIHNIGAGTREENRLFEFKLTGHYRLAGIGSAS